MTVTHTYLFNLNSDCSPKTCITSQYCDPQYYCSNSTWDTCKFKSQYYNCQACLHVGSVKFTECLLYAGSTNGSLYPVKYGFFESNNGKIYIETCDGCNYVINTPATFAVDDSNSRIILRNGALETKLNGCIFNCITANSIPFNTNTSLCNSYGNQAPVSFGYSISPVYDICDDTKFNVCKQYLATNNIATRQPGWTNEASFGYCYNGDTNCTLTKNYKSCVSCIYDAYSNLDCQKFCRQSFARPFSVHPYYYNGDNYSAYSNWHVVNNACQWCNGVGAAGNITCFTGKNTNCNLLTQVCWVTTLGPLCEKESAACYSTFIPSIYCPVTITGSGTAWCQAYNYCDVYNGYGINSQFVFTCFIQNRDYYGHCWSYQILPWCTNTSSYSPRENVAVRVSRSRTLVLNACTGMSCYDCASICNNLDLPSSTIYPFMYCLNSVSNVSSSWSYETPLPCAGNCYTNYLKADVGCTCTLVLPTCQQYWESKTEPADTSILATMHVVEPAMLYFSFAGEGYKGSYPSDVVSCIDNFLNTAYFYKRVPVNSNYPTSCYICHNNTWFTLRIPVVPKRECLVAAIQNCSGLYSNGVYSICPSYSSNCYCVGNSWFGFQDLNNFSSCYDSEYYSGVCCFYRCVSDWLKSDPTSSSICCYIDLNCFYSWLKETLECYNLEIFKGYALDITMCPYNRYDSCYTKAIQMYATNTCYASESYLQPGGIGTCPNGITNFACPERNYVCEDACRLKSIMTNLVNNCKARDIYCCCGNYARACFTCENNYTDFFGNGCCYGVNNTWHVNCYDASYLIETAVTVYTCCNYSNLNYICQCMGSRRGYNTQEILAELRSCKVPGADKVCIGSPNFSCQVFMSCNRPETSYCHSICSVPVSFYSSYSCGTSNYSCGAFGSAGEFRVIPKITIDYQIQNKTYFKGWPVACDI